MVSVTRKCKPPDVARASVPLWARASSPRRVGPSISCCLPPGGKVRLPCCGSGTLSQQRARRPQYKRLPQLRHSSGASTFVSRSHELRSAGRSGATLWWGVAADADLQVYDSGLDICGRSPPWTAAARRRLMVSPLPCRLRSLAAVLDLIEPPFPMWRPNSATEKH